MSVFGDGFTVEQSHNRPFENIGDNLDDSKERKCFKMLVASILFQYLFFRKQVCSNVFVLFSFGWVVVLGYPWGQDSDVGGNLCI